MYGLVVARAYEWTTFLVDRLSRLFTRLKSFRQSYHHLVSRSLSISHDVYGHANVHRNGRSGRRSILSPPVINRLLPVSNQSINEPNRLAKSYHPVSRPLSICRNAYGHVVAQPYKLMSFVMVRYSHLFTLLKPVTKTLTTVYHIRSASVTVCTLLLSLVVAQRHYHLPVTTVSNPSPPVSYSLSTFANHPYELTRRTLVIILCHEFQPQDSGAWQRYTRVAGSHVLSAVQYPTHNTTLPPSSPPSHSRVPRPSP